MVSEFSKLGLGEEMISVLEKLGITKPTPIQEKGIPHVVAGKDVIGAAATGSGKTLAFMSGIIEKVKKGKGVQALIMAPTRELATQIHSVSKDFATHTDLNIACVYGGTSFDRQVDAIGTSEIVIGTPGRILDHIKRRTLNLKQLKHLVLDEADRMVDMGFLPDVEKIIQSCPEDRQTLLFSATMSADIDYIEKKYMVDAVNIEVATQVDPSKLTQVFYDVPTHLKFSLLAHFLKQEKSGVVMVFCNTRRNVDLVTMNLNKYKIEAHAIHGGMDQNKRSKVMVKFHDNRADILVCTDVAARGLDIPHVTHVYNYDIPPVAADYVHRVGRTARAGKEGMAISLVSSKDYQNFSPIHSNDKLPITQKEVPDIEKLSPDFKRDTRGFHRDSRGGSRGGRSFGGRDGGRRDSGRSGGRGFGGRDNSRGSFGGRRNDSRGGRDSSRGSSFGRGRSDSRGGGSRGGRSFGGRDGGRRDSGRSGGRGFGGRDNSRGSFGGRRNDSRGGKSFGGRDSNRSSGRRDSGKSFSKKRY